MWHLGCEHEKAKKKQNFTFLSVVFHKNARKQMSTCMKISKMHFFNILLFTLTLSLPFGVVGTRGVIVIALDRGIVVSEFELQSGYYF